MSGGGSNHLCLESEPIFNSSDEVRSDQVEVYGAEYRAPLILDKHDVPCAVCQVTRTSVLIMPGTNQCKEGWTTEYLGQISADRSNSVHHRSELVCMDNDSEKTQYSNPEQEDGVIFYTTKVMRVSTMHTLCRQ